MGGRIDARLKEPGPVPVAPQVSDVPGAKGSVALSITVGIAAVCAVR
jgi:hypothetical protein